MGRYIIFSPINGELSVNGKPLAGAKLERSYEWAWGERRGADSVVTDEHGKFQFPLLEGSSMMAWLPHEPVVAQKIVTTYNGKEYKLWGCSKRNYKLNSEINGAEAVVHFHLEMEPVRLTPFCVGRFKLMKAF